MDNTIVVIDDELDFLQSIKRGLITSGFKDVRTEIDFIRERVIVTLKYNTCGSFVRMERERYEKSLKNPPTERGETQRKNSD